MAAILRSRAAVAANMGQPSSFYKEKANNPVLQSLNQELKLFMGYMKKRTAPGYRKPEEEAQSRPADTLFEIWNKFEPKLPKIYYQEKLLEVGDFLMSVKEYRLALWQCYDRYLLHFGEVNVEEITDVDSFKKIFFPSGFDGDNAGLTFRALMGKSISMYQVVRVSDPKLQNKESVIRCGHILAFLRLIMQVVLPKETLCWLVYNGTVHIYSISRYLMSLGHSAKVLEFLLWACMCMETSVPLLTVKYLSWRSTLYTAVCQCYYDCKASHHAESFARRGLAKINELSHLENLSSSTETGEKETAFRQATVKMAIMVFKRSVYETRRRPKGLHKPKTRANLKDALNLPWPRTPSEKSLADMFEGSAAQFLCILESLNDTNRRIVLTAPPASDNDVEILDVYAELFMAGQEILAGGGGHRGSSPKPPSSTGIQALAGIVKGRSLIDMATRRGEDGVTIDGAIKLVKYAYCFEQWEVFESLVEAVMTYLRIEGEDKYRWDEKALELLRALEKVNRGHKHRRQATVAGEEEKDKEKDKDKDKEKDKEKSEKEPTVTINLDHDVLPSFHAHSSKTSLNDELIQLADVLMTVVTGPFFPENIEVDMIVDAGLFLWNKCKTVFQKYQTGSLDNPRYLQKMENPTKWVYILDVVHQTLCWCGISSVDPALTAEVVLRLGLVLESSAQLDLEGKKGKSERRKTVTTFVEHEEAGRSTPGDKGRSVHWSPTRSPTRSPGRSSRGGTSDGRSPMKDSSASDLGALQDSSQPYFSRNSMLSSSLLNVNPRDQLLQAREILELGLQNVSFARQAVALTDGKSIADISWAKRVIPPHQLSPQDVGRTPPMTPIVESVKSSLSDVESVGSVAESTGVLKSSSRPKRELNEEVFTPEPQKEVTDMTEEAQVNPDDLVPESMRGTATAVWNTVKDLHLELILMYHRVCLKLESLGPDPSVSMPKPFKRRTCSKMGFGSERTIVDTYIESLDELLARCNKNQLSKALLYMQSAILLEGSGTKEQKKLLEKSVTCIQRAQVEEKKTYLDNTQVTEDEVKTGKVPPPPILLSRTDTSMVFKPAPFKPSSGEQVSWYRLFARSATGSNVKARLNDYYFPGTGEEVPLYNKELRVSGLSPNERYIFAVAAYTAEGKLIGDCVGESTKPILAIHPLPILTTWAFLSQLSYQIGCYDISRQASNVLWDHFIAERPPPEGVTYTTSCEADFKLTLMKLNQKVVCLTSPVLLRQFLTSIFVSVDISVREGQLFCDVLCDKGPLYTGEIRRLKECEKMLVAIELAGWLNEANLALQAVVQCYGLLAPLIFYKIPSVSVLQVLQRCHVVLQEVPSGLRQKRQSSIADSLHHMTACITYHMAKVLRTWGQKSLSNGINDAGRKLLALESGETMKDLRGEPIDKLEAQETMATEGSQDQGSINLHSLKSKKKGRKAAAGMVKEHEPEGPLNEELKALEAHMLSMTKQTQSEHELSGSEDPNILHAYIAYLPSKIAYREVVKFKKRARYLEFFVQVAQKALTEGLAEQVIDWCEDSENWIARRNEQIIGTRAFMTKQPGGTITVSGDDPKKFAAAMVEYSKEKEMTTHTSPRAPVGGSKMIQPTKPAGPATQKPKRRHKYKALLVTPNMSDAARQAQEEAEVKAIEKLGNHLPDLYRGWLRKKRLRKICSDETPWRCQLNIVQGLSQFSSFLGKLEKREKMYGMGYTNMYKTNFLDQEWFTFETAGTLVVGWEGGPTARGHQEHMLLHVPDRKKEERKFSRITERDDSDDSDAELPPPKHSRKKSHVTKSSITDGLDLATYHERTYTTTTGIEIAAALAIGAAPKPTFTVPPEVEDTPRTYRSDISTARARPKEDPEKILLTSQDTMDALNKTFNYFKKAVVLAHRGQHWTLLQNSVRALWNCAHTALLRASTPNLPEEDNGLLTVDELRSLVWKPMHMAADCILDMMVILQVDLESQAVKAKNRQKVLGDYFDSWMGRVTDEKGGASLKFENPVDDQSVIDARWMRRMVLRVMEMLYFEERWEKLVDIALKFNGLTNDRYSEQVIPLLVQAQRKLTEGIRELGGKEPPQPHFQELMFRLNSVVTAKDYLHSQLLLVLDKDNLPKVPQGAGIDPLGHGLYTSKDALKNVSVPLDTSYTLTTLYEAFDKSQYTSRALQHSRKLMVLYLAANQNIADGALSRGPSRVDFIPNTARPQPTMPPDISREEYLDPSDVLTAAIPRSQLGTVINSYEKTIEMLLAKNQRGLAAQAMHEIGNLQYHAGNIRAGYKWWADALDLTLNAADALHTWRNVFKDGEDISAMMLDRCGLWGCVLGGILTSNIAQYVLTSDLGLRTECCFLSGYLFKALFRSSLPHPKADRNYALYDVGEGCEVTNLVPGVDLLSDRYRSDGRQLVAALRWVTEELSRGQHNLFVLPLLTLNLYFTTFVCRDLQRSVDVRILKVRVLTDLHLFTEAFIVLQRLLHGERLPHTGDSSFRQVESKMSPIKFNTTKPITEPSNLKLLENVLDKRLSSNLGTLYGPHMTCHLSLVQAHLFVTLAESIPVLPAVEEVILPEGQHVLRQVTMTTQSKAALTTTKTGKTGKSNQPSQKSSKTSVKADEKEGKEDGSEHSATGYITKRFTGSKKPITLEFIKGTLLVIADNMVGTISDVIQENAEMERGVENLSAAELELVVLCKLEQAAVARLKHHAPMAARIVFTTLKLLQSANIFKPKKNAPHKPREFMKADRPSSMKGQSGQRKPAKPRVNLTEPENSLYQYQDFQSRSRLDARLWLVCRAALVKSLMMEIRGMGEVKGISRVKVAKLKLPGMSEPECGSDNKVLQELADCRQYCAEGLGEAEACGDVEMQAEFLIQGACLNIIEGKSLQHTISLLQDAFVMLVKVPSLSVPGEMMLATAIILRTDLEAIEREDESVLFTERTMDQYIYAQTIILRQMENLGEVIEHYYPENLRLQFSAPVSPLRNVYLPQVLRLAQIKLRVGHAMSRSTAKHIRIRSERNPVTMWSDTLSVLLTALELSQASVTREANLEAEILLNIGKVERMLVYHGKYQARAAVDTLLRAIRTTHATDHDLGLMRQAYLEIALVYLHSSGIAYMKEGSALEVVMDSGDEASSVKTGKESQGKESRKKWKSKKERTKSKTKEDMNEQEKEKRAAWLAIRCAAAMAKCQRSSLLLIGDVSVTSQKLSEKAQTEMPDFAALDLISTYVLGEKKKVYKSEIEEELAPLIEAQETKHTETYDEQVQKAKEAATELSWIHFLGYKTILQRLCSTSTISASSVKSDLKRNKSAGDLGPDFDLGFISHAQCDVTLNHDVVRSMLYSGTWSSRLSRMHTYLADNLTVYEAECCGVYPPAELELPPVSETKTDLPLLHKSYTANWTNPTDLEGETMQIAVEIVPGQPTVPPGSHPNPVKPSDKTIVAPTENEVTLQWYQPSLEETDPSRPDAVGAESRILLLYAINKHPSSGVSSIQTKIIWVSLSQLHDLHDRLSVLMQRAEIYLLEKPKKEPVPPSPTPTAPKSKKTMRIKALSPKVQRDEQLEALLRQCVDDIGNLLGALLEHDTGATTEIPFEVKSANIKMLESLFDPSFGSTVKGTDLVQWLMKLFP